MPRYTRLRLQLNEYRIKHNRPPVAFLVGKDYAPVDPQVRTLAGIPVAIDPDYYGEPLILEPEGGPHASLPDVSI